MEPPSAAECRRDPAEKVQAAIKELRNIHAEGKDILKSYPFGRKSRKKTMVAEARERGFSHEVVYKWRVFADPNLGYTDDELNALCGLCKELGVALGASFIPKFLTIRDKAERAEFQRRAISGRWTIRRVMQELLLRYGNRRKAGGRHKILSTEDLLTELRSKAIWWRRLYKMLARKSGKQVRSAGLSRDDIPGGIQEPLKQAVRAIKKLENAVTRHLDQLRKEPEKSRAQKQPGGTAGTAPARTAKPKKKAVPVRRAGRRPVRG